MRGLVDERIKNGAPMQATNNSKILRVGTDPSMGIHESSGFMGKHRAAIISRDV